MNMLSSVAFGLLTILAWVQVIGTLYVYALNPKQLNDTRYVAAGISAGYLILAVLGTITFMGWI